jgi:hypothetical protein
LLVEGIRFGQALGEGDFKIFAERLFDFRAVGE